jgi:alpha-beta hydrolase superfamily lysophospholipase
MKKPLLLLLHIIWISFTVSAQTEPANYQAGVLQFKNYYNKGAVDSIFNMFNANMKAALPLDKMQQMTQQLKTQLGDIKTTELKSFNNEVANYKTTFTNGVFALKMSFDAGNKLTGLLVQPYQEEMGNAIDPGLTETAVNVTAVGASLSGSIITPKNSTAKIPVVLIIAGSGATDRNGNTAGAITANSSFLLAEALGKAGIATARYDKRGIGKSTSSKTEIDLRFDDFVNDAIALIKQLKADPRFSKVIVLGHSEGSLVGMLAAEREKVNAYISLAGAGDAINKILEVQLKNESPEAYKVTLGRLDSLSKGLTVKANAADPLFRPSVQPYMISWIKYNPQQEIKKLKIPVLIVNGITDIQVSVDNAQNLKKAKPDATLVLINGMNHILKQAPADREENIKTYNNPKLPVDTELVKAITAFVGKLK